MADTRRRRADRHQQHHAAKRNPNALHNVRVGASKVLGVGTTYLFKAHNVPHGLSDYKGGEPVEALNRMARMLNGLTAVVKQLNFNANARIDEVNADYSTTTELADVFNATPTCRFASDITLRRSSLILAGETTYGRLIFPTIKRSAFIRMRANLSK